MKYIPIVKATTAELTAIERLDSEVKKYITPLFEIGKSRRTSKLPEGDIYRCYEQIHSKYKSGKFILDITSHPDLSNSQVERLFDENNGYENWCDFIIELGNKDIIPVIQVVADSPSGLNEVTKQVTRLLSFSSQVVLRIPFLEPEMQIILDSVRAGLSDAKQLVIIFDAGYMPIALVEKTAQELQNQLDLLESLDQHYVVLASSSFPRAVNSAGYGGDEDGCFPIEEVNLFTHVSSKNLNLNLIYSDYGLIHPNRYAVRGGTWIPRIDMPLKNEVYYYRCRNKNTGQGYIDAAQRVVSNNKYISVGAWGNQQIEAAANGHPPGRSPSYWIAVRSNIHITTQAKRIGTMNN